MSDQSFDAIVLGAGPAGEVMAGLLADAGWSVAIVERDLIGGECSYYACMPSKALLRPADILAEARRIPGVPVDESSELDPAAILARRDEVIHDEDDSGQLPWLEERGIALFRGDGRFSGEREVRVGDDTLRAEKVVVVATGSGAAMPPIDGLDTVRAWNNREATTAKKVPASMIVLGGGPVGSELAQAWASLGTEVTLVEGADHLLGRDEPFAGEEVADGAARALRRRRAARRRRSSRSAPAAPGWSRRSRAAARSRPRRSWSRSVASPTPTGSGWRRSGSSPTSTASSSVDDRLRGRAAASGSTRSATSTAAPSSPTAASTRPGWRRGTCSATTSRPAPKRFGSPHVTFTDPQVAAVGKTLAQAEEDGIERARDRRPDRRLARAPASRARTPAAPRGWSSTSRQRDDRRRHLHRLRDRRLPAGGDDRDRRRGADRAAAPRARRPTPRAARSG